MKRILFILILCLYAAWCSARIPTQIRSRFHQVRTVALLEKEITNTGVFTFDAPDKVTWTYDDGSAARLPAQMLTFIRKAVTGDFENEQTDFTITAENDTTILTPKKKQLKQLFSDIRLRLNPQTGVAEEVVLNEANGDVTRITFFETQIR